MLNGMKWVIRHRTLRTAVKHALREPIATLIGMYGGQIAKTAYLLRRVVGIPQKATYTYYKELQADDRFWKYLNEKIIEARHKQQRVGGWIGFNTACTLYILVRATKPKFIVETGVGPGNSSAFILNALSMNGVGHLYSIDLPRMLALTLPRGFNTGWLIPTWLKKSWTLILGDARLEHPKLLKKIGVIDMFLHDSLHTYEHMMFEYITAYKALSHRGLLLSHDVSEHWSLAFIDFCKEKRISYYVFPEGLGVAKKP